MKKFTVFTLVLFVLALVLAACGGGEESGPAQLSFEGNDQFQFILDSATVSAGQEVEVTMSNVGALEHSWVLVAPGTDAATATDADAIQSATTGTIAAGETSTITFTAPDAGAYQFVCTVAGHAAAGMVGTLTVE